MTAGRPVSLFVVAAIVLVVGIGVVRAKNAPPQSQRGLSDQEVQSAADQLLLLVNPSRSNNSYYPLFAKQEIQWMIARTKAKALSIIEGPGQLKFERRGSDGRRIVDGKRSIVISQPRFMRLLIEAGTVRAPFALR